MENKDLKVYVVYFNPTDYPQKYVVRTHTVTEAGAQPNLYALAFDTLEGARASIPDDRVYVGRYEEDDPAILETWF